MAERLSGYFGTDPREADAFLPFRRRRLRHGLTQPPQQLRNTQGRPRRIAIPRNPTGDPGRLKPALPLDHERIHTHPNLRPQTPGQRQSPPPESQAPKPRSPAGPDPRPTAPPKPPPPTEPLQVHSHAARPYQRPFSASPAQEPRAPNPRRPLFDTLAPGASTAAPEETPAAPAPEETPAAPIAEESPAPIAAARTDRRSAAMDPDPLQARSNALQ